MNNMTGDIVLKLMDEAGINQTELAERMGIDRRNLNQMLRRGQDIKTKPFTEMLECMGFDMRLVKTGTVRVNHAMLSRIADTGEPKGRYWSTDSIGALFTGVVNDDAGSRIQEFADRSDLMEWLTA